MGASAPLPRINFIPFFQKEFHFVLLAHSICLSKRRLAPPLFKNNPWIKQINLSNKDKKDGVALLVGGVSYNPSFHISTNQSNPLKIIGGALEVF